MLQEVTAAPRDCLLLWATLEVVQSMLDDLFLLTLDVLLENYSCLWLCTTLLLPANYSNSFIAILLSSVAWARSFSSFKHYFFLRFSSKQYLMELCTRARALSQWLFHIHQNAFLSENILAIPKMVARMLVLAYLPTRTRLNTPGPAYTEILPSAQDQKAFDQVQVFYSFSVVSKEQGPESQLLQDFYIPVPNI